MGSEQESMSWITGYIEGDNVSSDDDTPVGIINPSDGRRIALLPSGTLRDVDLAVASARRAFDDGRWKDATPTHRKATLYRFADLIDRHAQALDLLDAEEMGKPIAETAFNAVAAAALVRFYAECIDKITGDVFSSERRSLVLQRRVPRGVVAAVVPWNFPTYVAALKIAPALAAANSVVLKPSELSSRSAIRLAQLASEAGIPPGVLNIVPGLGTTVGQALALHHDVDMLTFTGSTQVGRLMLQYAGQSNLKVVMAECGGKSPQILFADGVDIDAASESIARSILTNQGQVCSVGSRLLIQRSIETEVVEKIARHFAGAVIGAATDTKATFGPVASVGQCDRVMQYIDVAHHAGALLVTGGKRTLERTGGYFIEPTIFRNVSPESRLAREEIFGPVLAVTSFGDEADAIRLANSTVYGLCAYVWTASLSRAMRVAKGIRSDVIVSSDAYGGEGAALAASWEPAGQSGFGTEGGVAGMESYLRRQLIGLQHA